MTLYRIKNWDHFETYETKKLKHLAWVPTPNKHDGLGFRKIAARKDRCELFSAWNLMLQIASKTQPPLRGSLIRDDKPLSAEDLELMTGFPSDIFTKAFQFFSCVSVGWLEASPALTGELPAIVGEAAAEQNRTEGTEQKEQNYSPSEGELAEQIYQSYPKRQNHKAALQKIAKAVKEHGFDFIMGKVQEFAKAKAGADLQYVPAPDVWFNKEKFNDDPKTWLNGRQTHLEIDHSKGF